MESKTLTEKVTETREIDADKINHLRDVKAILKGMRLKVEVDSEDFENVKHLLKEELK